MPHCLDPGTAEVVEVRTFDGQNWETTYKQEQQKKDGSILNFSKEWLSEWLPYKHTT